MSKPERIGDNLKSFEIQLSEEVLKFLNTLFAENALKGGRYPAHLSGFTPE